MVTVVMTTYNPTPDAPRFSYAKRCIEAFDDHLMVDPFVVHVTDDGSPDTQLLMRLVTTHNITVTTGRHNGIGASLNRALRHVEGPWMYTTDDWLLTGFLELELPLWLLSEGYDLVKLGPIHPNLSCRTRFSAGHGWWLELNLLDPQGGFHFATRPFLAAPSLVEKIGLFDEGLDSYETEVRYNARCQMEAFNLKFAAVNLAGPWEHIGEYEVGNLPVVPAFSLEKGGAS